jgi:hypothetical protein
MKTVKVTLPHLGNQVVEMYLIENEEDASEYFSFNKNIAAKCFDHVLKHRLPIENFDHMGFGYGTVESSIMTLALHRAKSNKIDVDKQGRSIWNNPLYQLFPAAAEKEMHIRRFYDEHGAILVNKNGGFMPLERDQYTILETYDTVIHSKAPQDEMNEKNRWIVLENDYMLPQESQTFLQKMDPNFSIVFDLRGHKEDRLFKTFEWFKKHGGEVVFVYTTGLDVEQMYEYTKCMKKAGLNTLKFHFNAGRNPDIDKFLEWAKKFLGCEVEVYETLPK